MGSGIKWIAFGIFVLATTAQLISMLTSFMVTNPYSKYFHDGIFYRWGDWRLPQTEGANNSQPLNIRLKSLVNWKQNCSSPWKKKSEWNDLFGSEQIHIFEHIPMSQQHLDSILSRKNEVNTWFRPMPSICYWWNHEVFMTDRSKFQLRFFYQSCWIG